MASAVFGNGGQEHASVRYYVIGLVVVAACAAMTILAYFWAGRLAAISTHRRPRWLYGLAAVGCSLPVVIFVASRSTTSEHMRRTRAAGRRQPAAWSRPCVLAGLLMLGRALAWGRKRRASWLFPPQWLDHDLLSLELHDRDLPERELPQRQPADDRT